MRTSHRGAGGLLALVEIAPDAEWHRGAGCALLIRAARAGHRKEGPGRRLPGWT